MRPGEGSNVAAMRIGGLMRRGATSLPGRVAELVRKWAIEGPGGTSDSTSPCDDDLGDVARFERLAGLLRRGSSGHSVSSNGGTTAASVQPVASRPFVVPRST